MEARRLFNPDVILVGVVVITGLSAITDTLIRKLTGYITRWSERSASS
jgi:ABC-type nitrate/sulfonate/bicarbonate transport system permease component